MKLQNGPSNNNNNNSSGDDETKANIFSGEWAELREAQQRLTPILSRNLTQVTVAQAKITPTTVAHMTPPTASPAFSIASTSSGASSINQTSVNKSPVPPLASMSMDLDNTSPNDSLSSVSSGLPSIAGDVSSLNRLNMTNSSLPSSPPVCRLILLFTLFVKKYELIPKYSEKNLFTYIKIKL